MRQSAHASTPAVLRSPPRQDEFFAASIQHVRPGDARSRYGHPDTFKMLLDAMFGIASHTGQPVATSVTSSGTDVA